MIVVIKDDKKSNERLMREFTNKVRKKRHLPRLKARKVYSKKLNKATVRANAVRAARKREETELLIKKGKIQPRQSGRRRP